MFPVFTASGKRPVGPMAARSANSMGMARCLARALIMLLLLLLARSPLPGSAAPAIPADDDAPRQSGTLPRAPPYRARGLV